MTIGSGYQFARIDDGVSYQYGCVCPNLLKKNNTGDSNWWFCAFRLIDQIDPISVDLITFYIQQLIVIKIML